MLWSYVAHSNAPILEVKDINESVAVSALKRELQSDGLSFFLDKFFLRNYANFLMHAGKYVQADKSYFLDQKKKGKK